MKRFLLLLVVVLLAYLATGISKVGPEERAVVRRFGRVVARPGPGLWIGFPYGIDRLDRIPVRTARQLAIGYTLEIGEDPGPAPNGQYLTGDQNLIHLRLSLEYAIDDRDGELENSLMQSTLLESQLQREAETLAAEWVAGHTVDDVLLTGRARLPQWMLPRLNARVENQNLGIQLSRLSVELIEAPPEVRLAFEEVNKAQTSVALRENEARLEANRRQREAEAIRYKYQQLGEAYRTEKVTAANAEAQAFLKRLEQYQKLRTTNPDILSAIWWESMGRVLISMRGRGRVDLLDHHLTPNGLDITNFVTPKRPKP
ncbi:MAG: SPFH domain-containing protein [Fimbriiglobus sp.]